MAANNMSEEIENLSKKLIKDPSSRLFLPLAEKYRDAGMLEEAEKVLRDGLTYHPDYVSAIFSLGRVLHEKGNIDAAFDKFREVVKSAPDNLLAHKKVAEIALDKDLVGEALDSLRMVVRLNPSDEKAQELIDRYDKRRAEPVNTPPLGGFSPGGGVPEFETFETSATVAEPPASPKPDQSSWLSGPPEENTVQEVAQEPRGPELSEGISLPGFADEEGISIDLSEFASETSAESPTTETTTETTTESMSPEASFEVEHMTRDFAYNDAYKLPAVEDINLDEDFGIQIPTTLTPVTGQLEPEYSWSEPVSLDPESAEPEEESVPVHEIFEEEEEPSSAAAISPPPPDESLQQLFSEIAGDSALMPDMEPEEQVEEEIETETVAELYIQQGDYEKARNIYGSLLIKNPGSSSIRQKLEELQFLINLIGQKEQS